METVSVSISKHSALWNVIKIEKIILVLAITFFTAIVLRSAWLSDDAYITFRTVDNFINGYGLTWNTVERVQAYTHPLWMFLLSGIYAVTREIYYSSIFLSVAITLVAVIVLTFGLAASTETALFGLLILMFSKAFVDYSTSGLENPVTHMLLAGFLLVYLKAKTITVKGLFFLSLLAGLATFNRMDALLLFLPVLLYAVFKLSRFKGAFIIVAGFLPFVLWELFSLFYYGFLFPNTAYAKLNTGISSWELIPFGFFYVLNSLNWDPVTVLIIIIGILWPFFTKQRRTLPPAMGIVLYLLYVLKIGGDFMSGRFFSAPLFVAVALLINSNWLVLQTKRIPILIGGIILAGLIVRYPYVPVFSTADYGLNQDLYSINVEDGRGVYFQASGLLNVLQHNNNQMPDHRWANLGRLAKLDAPCVIPKGGVGYFGFFAGPKVYVLDILALGDPLLARMPATAPNWSIGHFARLIPHGYLETLDSGQNHITDKNLAAYYHHLSLITQADLFSRQRLAAIWQINLGKYQNLITAYSPFFQVRLPQTGKLWTPADKLEHYNGIELDLGPIQHAPQIEVQLTDMPIEYHQKNASFEQCKIYKSADNPQAETSHQLIYFDGSRALVRQSLVFSTNKSRQVIEVPPIAVNRGYSHIKIFTQGQRYLDPTIYSIEQIRLLEN